MSSARRRGTLEAVGVEGPGEEPRAGVAERELDREGAERNAPKPVEAGEWLKSARDWAGVRKWSRIRRRVDRSRSIGSNSSSVLGERRRYLARRSDKLSVQGAAVIPGSPLLSALARVFDGHDCLLGTGPA